MGNKIYLALNHYNIVIFRQQTWHKFWHGILRQIELPNTVKNKIAQIDGEFLQ